MKILLKQKIILGTVQLGLPYGINNSLGKPSEQDAFRILDFAFDNNIRTLDSADGYGEALHVIGRHFKVTGKRFDIINKFKADEVPLAVKAQKSLELLQCGSLSCYMYHQFSDYESKIVARELKDLKKDGLVKRTGVSLYSTEELSKVINDPEIDVIQLPVNILDLSREKQTLLRRAKDKGKEIHARSIFLQGIFFKKPESLTGNLIPLGSYIHQLTDRCKTSHVELKSAALNFVIHQDYVDYVVLGIEQVSQLKENFDLLDPNFNIEIFNDFEISPTHTYLLNPVNWKR